MQPGFSFPNFTEAEIKSLNVRAEVHGKDFVPAIDLGLRIRGSNQMLLMFGLGRYYGYFVPGDATADEEPPQAELDGIEAVSARPKLRFNVESESLGVEYTGVNLVLDYGSGGKSNIELFGNVKKVNIAEFHDGGSITLEFTLQASGVDDKIVGKLSGLLRHKIKFTALRSAEAEGSQERIAEAEPGLKASPSADKATQKEPEKALAEDSTPATPKQLAAAERAAEKAVAKKVVPLKSKDARKTPRK